MDLSQSVAMEPFNLQDRIFCVEAYLEFGRSVTRARRAFQKSVKSRRNQKVPSETAIKRWVQSFRTTGAIDQRTKQPGERRRRTPETIAEVSRIIEENPQQSIRRISSIVGASYWTTRTIMRKDLKLRPFKHQRVQQLKPGDPEKRLEFANQMLEQFPTFDNILFSDEAHFYLHGFMNRQNNRTWAQTNPCVIVENPLHAARVTVWAGLASWGVVGPFYFEEEGNGGPVTVTVNSARYGAMLRGLDSVRGNFPDWNDRTWFQQDGAPPHRARVIMDYLKQTYPGRLISLGGNVLWPPRSPDLSPLDFYLWGYLKGKVYDNNPTTLAQLKENIEREIAAIPLNTLTNVMLNFRNRMIECQAQNGGHLPNVIFKK